MKRVIAIATALAWIVTLTTGMSLLLIALRQAPGTWFVIAFLAVALLGGGMLIGVAKSLDHMWLTARQEEMESIQDLTSELQEQIDELRRKVAHDTDLVAHADGLLRQIERLDAAVTYCEAR